MEVAQQQDLRAIMVVPAILEQLLHDPKSTDLLRGLEFLGYGGSPLPGPVGDRVSSIVRLRNFIGSTETFPLPELAKSPEDWQYRECLMDRLGNCHVGLILLTSLRRVQPGSQT